MCGAAIRLAFEIAPPRLHLQLPDWGPLRASGVDWSARSDCRDRLIEADDPQWDAWLREGVVEVVKSGPHRTVYRLNFPEGEFYVKRYRVPDWKTRLRNLFRKSPAECEFQAAKRIAELKLPTFDPVAVGRRSRLGIAGETWLVSEAISEAVPLDQYITGSFPHLTPRRQASLRQRLARELGRVVARLHLAGIDHVDLHAGNLLIRSESIPDDQVLSLIDLHSVRFRRSLSQRRRDKNLGILHQFFAGRSHRTDRLRFWLAYQKELQGIEKESPSSHDTSGSRTDTHRRRDWRHRVETRAQLSACRRLESMLENSTVEGWRRADRAWKRGNRHVRKIDTPGTQCRGLATLDADWLTSLRDAPEALFDQSLIRWCKQSRRHRVAEVRLTGAEEGRRAYWKCIDEKPGWRRWLSKWRFSAVRRAWEIGHALLRRGIDTPRPLLFVEQTRSAVPRSYLLTEAVAESIGVGEFFETTWPAFDQRQRDNWLRSRGRSLAGQLRRLHESGFDHRDLKFSNLLVSTIPTDARTWFLDLDAVREWRSLPRSRALQNLSRLAVSALLIPGIGRAVRLRFLKTYLGHDLGQEWKVWWRALDRLSQKKIARNVHRSRPLS